MRGQRPAPSTGTTRAPAARQHIQRQCSCGGSCASCSDDQKIHRHPDARGLASTSVSGGARGQHDSGGHPLPAPVRADFEGRFGHDFSRVRVHDDAEAHDRSRRLGAEAYTFGSHIHFAAGRFEPRTPGGRALLAHELAHTLQQGSAAPAAESEVAVGEADSPLEAAADQAAHAALSGGAAGPAVARGGGAAPAIRRQPAPAPTDPGWHPDFIGCNKEQSARMDNLLLVARALVEGSIGDLEDLLTKPPSPSGIITRVDSALTHNFHTSDPADIKVIIGMYKHILRLLELGPKNIRCLTAAQCDVLCSKGDYACSGPGLPIRVCLGQFDASRGLFYSLVLIHEAAHQAGAPVHSYDKDIEKAIRNEKVRARLSANAYADFAEDRAIGSTGSMNPHRR